MINLISNLRISTILVFLLICVSGVSEETFSQTEYNQRVLSCAQENPGDMGAVRECLLRADRNQVRLEPSTSVVINGLTISSTQDLDNDVFQPSRAVRGAFGDDFDWSQFPLPMAEEIAFCIEESECHIKAFKVSLAKGISPLIALELSKCVDDLLCDLDAFLEVYASNESDETSFEVSRCVSIGECDLEAFLEVNQATLSVEDAFRISRCVNLARSRCDLQSFLKVYEVTISAQEAYDVSRCVAIHRCSDDVYLEQVTAFVDHAEALKLAHEAKSAITIEIPARSSEATDQD